MRLPLLLAVLCLPLPASAGAWMREVGTTFLSFSTTIDEARQIGGSMYVAHGFRPKLTLGAKIDVDMLDGFVGDSTGFVFARKPISTGEGPHKLAYEIGIGGTLDPDNLPVPLLRAGLSYGRGFTLWDKVGWVALDGAAEREVSNSITTYKLDSTIGLTLTARFQVMMQVFLSKTENEVSTTFAPSVMWRPKKDGPTRYHFGLEKEDGILAVRLGLWRTF